MKPITQTSKTINTRTISTSALHAISTATPETFRATIRDYVNARKKERNTTNATTTKAPRTVEFTARDSVDTPPAITPYVASVAPFVKHCNNITAHAEEHTRRFVALVNDGDHYTSATKDNNAQRNRSNKNNAWRRTANHKTINGGYCDHHPYKPLLFGGRYYEPITDEDYSA